MPEKDWVSFDCVIFDHAVGYLTSLRRSKRPKDFFFFSFSFESWVCMSDVIDYRLAVTQEHLYSGTGFLSWVDGPASLSR